MAQSFLDRSDRLQMAVGQRLPRYSTATRFHKTRYSFFVILHKVPCAAWQRGDRPSDQLLTQFHSSVTSLIRNTSELDDAYRAATILRAASESAKRGVRIDV